MKYRPKLHRRRNNSSPTQEPFFPREGVAQKDSQLVDPFFNSSPQIQPKLSVSQPNEPAEIQADNVADKVVSHINKPGINRKCADCEKEDKQLSRSIFRMEEEEEAMQAKLMRQEEEEEEMMPKLMRQEEEEEEMMPKLMRQEEEEEEEMMPKLMRQEEEEETMQAKLMRQEEEEEAMQAKANGQITTAPQSVSSQLKQCSGAGRPMAEPIKSKMESAFGSDFSSVKIHTDDKAVQMSQQINAQAFTYGADIYFNSGKYNPQSQAGQHLLAHELTHVVQQKKNLQRVPDDQIARNCITDTTVSWSQRVNAAKGIILGDQDACIVGMMREALGTGVPIVSSTNDAATLDAAITAGHYTPRGTTQTINYDANLNTKTGDANQYGQATYKRSGNTTTVYIVLGPNALDPVGPQLTQMANAHEQAHADDYVSQSANGGAPHAATPAEELRIYVDGFTTYMLSLITIINTDTNCAGTVHVDFQEMFSNYPSANRAQKNTAFNNIRDFYNNTVRGNADNEVKFKYWFQEVMNARDASDALVTRINGLTGLGLTKGTDSLDHICPETAE